MQVISFDVKPANVLLDRTGRHAKLADVGLAKILEHSQTMTNMVSLLLLTVHRPCITCVCCSIPKSSSGAFKAGSDWSTASQMAQKRCVSIHHVTGAGHPGTWAARDVWDLQKGGE